MMEVFASTLTQADGLLTVIQDARPPWAGHRHRRAEPQNTRRDGGVSLAAIDELRAALDDGRWHRNALVDVIAKRHGTTGQSLLITASWLLPLCESDNGQFVALLSDRLPVDEPRLRRRRECISRITPHKR